MALQHNYRHPPNKAALREACHDKCMYCESKISHTYWGDVEHIKPKARFPHLEFTWENLGYVCARCNGAKGDKWNEQQPFVDPFLEDPAEHLAAVGQFVFHRNGSERGELSWREIALNRPELLERRLDRLHAVARTVDKAMRTTNPQLRVLVLAELEHDLADHCEYAMACRAAYAQLNAQPAA